MVTLGQLWSLPELALDIRFCPPGAEAREVSIVHTSELPTVDEWLAGGELVMSIGALHDLNSAAAQEYVARLTKAGAVAIGVGLGSQLPHTTVPEPLIAACRHHQMPVFGVNEPVPFVAVVAAFTRLREEAAARALAQALRTQRRLITRAGRDGPAGVVAELSQALGLPVSVCSATGRPLLGADPAPEVSAGLIAQLHLPASLSEPAERPVSSPRLIPTLAGHCEAVPLSVPGMLTSWLCIGPMPTGHADGPTRVVLTSAAVSLLEAHPALATRLTPINTHTPAGDFALGGEADAEGGQADAAGGQADAAGGRAGQLLVVSLPSGQRSLAHSLLADAAPGAAQAVSGELCGMWCTSSAERQRLQAVSGALHVEVLTDVTVRRGELAQLWADITGHQLPARTRVASLLAAIPAADRDQFITATLGGLVQDRSSEEFATLSALVASGGSRETVAAVLGVHRHTVRARINRLARLLDRDLDDPAELQALALAVRLIHSELP